MLFSEGIGFIGEQYSLRGEALCCLQDGIATRERSSKILPTELSKDTVYVSFGSSSHIRLAPDKV
jgi:hypothetical protein